MIFTPYASDEGAVQAPLDRTSNKKMENQKQTFPFISSKSCVMKRNTVVCVNNKKVCLCVYNWGGGGGETPE